MTDAGFGLFSLGASGFVPREGGVVVEGAREGGEGGGDLAEEGRRRGCRGGGEGAEVVAERGGLFEGGVEEGVLQRRLDDVPGSWKGDGKTIGEGSV